MDDPDFSQLAAFHELGGEAIPGVIGDLAEGRAVELVWRNELGGLTFRIDDFYAKYNPHATGIDLERERVRLEWLTRRFPAPRVRSFGSDRQAQWLVTESLVGDAAVGDTWRARRSDAVQAIADGLRAIHAVSIDDFPDDWISQSWVARSPSSLGPRPTVDRPVLVHGDACAPNTVITSAGEWSGNVDFGDLGVGDRWADLAIASLSLDWNFGEGHQHELFEAYGIEPDPRRIEYYRALWESES